jgi:hypothetical protein
MEDLSMFTLHSHPVSPEPAGYFLISLLKKETRLFLKNTLYSAKKIYGQRRKQGSRTTKNVKLSEPPWALRKSLSCRVNK